MPYGENVAGDVDTMSRWAKVRTKRVEALTRRVMSIAFTRGRTARTVANVARTDDGVVAAACADDDIDNIKDNDAVATAGNDVNVKDVVGIIDDGVDVSVFSTGIDNSDNVDADTDAVIELMIVLVLVLLAQDLIPLTVLILVLLFSLTELCCRAL